MIARDVEVEELKDVAHDLVLEGKLFVCGRRPTGEVEYVHAAFATEAERKFSADFMAKVHKGLEEL